MKARPHRGRRGEIFMDKIAVGEILQKAKRLFFVGIGGISMSSLAFVCRDRGFMIAGSDRATSEMTDRLEKAGIPVVHEHRAENIEGADAIVYTGAVTLENPEMAAAKEKGLPMIYRADLLGYIMSGYCHRIGVAGMHGKSTATSMLAHLFLDSGRNPTVLSGAETEEMGGAYIIGGKDYFIFEACEYKDSFLSFYPSISVILNVDLDHTDYFTGGLSQICDSFHRYATLPFAQENVLPVTVINADDAHTAEILRDVPNYVTFGVEKEADFYVRNISFCEGKASFDVMKRGEKLFHVQLPVLGKHNVYNALASAAVGDLLGISPEETARALASFTGLRRRFEYKGDVNGAPVYIDYAHHPREIAATLAGARAMAKGKIICFFEPHTYSRTASLLGEFSKAFAEADEIFFLDIYAAREENLWGVSSEALAKMTPRGAYASSYTEAVDIIKKHAAAGDMVMILGAGTVAQIAQLLFEKE